jgi:hypothetical protein
MDVVENCGVLLVPSTLFNYGSTHIRIGFGRKNLPVALKQLDLYLQKVNEK